MSRTVGENQVVDELILSFTHDIEMDAILPGVPPTGRQVTLPFCVVVGFEDGKVKHEHIYWDQGSALAQIGLIDADGPARDRRRAGREPDRTARGAHEPPAA